MPLSFPNAFLLHTTLASADKMLKKSCPSVQCPCSHTHVDEGLVGEVKELVELDSTVGVLLERTRGLLGGSLLAGSELSLRELAALNCSSAVGFVLWFYISSSLPPPPPVLLHVETKDQSRTRCSLQFAAIPTMILFCRVCRRGKNDQERKLVVVSVVGRGRRQLNRFCVESGGDCRDVRTDFDEETRRQSTASLAHGSLVQFGCQLWPSPEVSKRRNCSFAWPRVDSVHVIPFGGPSRVD